MLDQVVQVDGGEPFIRRAVAVELPQATDHIRGVPGGGVYQMQVAPDFLLVVQILWAIEQHLTVPQNR